MKCLKAHGNFKACKARVEEVKTEKWSMNFSCRCFMVSLKVKENHKLHNLVKTLLLIHSTLPADICQLNTMVPKTVAAWSTVFKCLFVQAEYYLLSSSPFCDA